MSAVAEGTAPEAGPPPALGMTVYLEGVLGGPWLSMVVARSGDRLTIAAPRRAGSAVSLAEGREFLLCYSVREVPCEVDAVWVDGPAPHGDDEVVHVRLLGAPRRMQRRGAVRVPVQLVVRTRLEAGRDVPASSQTMAAVTENLSAGGALLRAAEPLPALTELVLTISPPGGEPMDLPSRVVRCDRDLTGPRPWRVAVAFEQMTPAQEESIVRYVFRLQREWRGRQTGMGQ